MGPVLWWWRWWSGVDPNRDKQLVEARSLTGQVQERADELTSELDARNAEVAALHERLTDADNELQKTRRAGDQLRNRITELETAATDADQLRNRITELEAERHGAGSAEGHDAPDVSTATEVLARRIELDDLTVIEGIGPKIAGLLADAGLDSWRKLAAADTARLRDVLTEAGPRYRVHDPSEWPQQAALLARGQWRDFRDLVAELRDRRSA